MTEHVDMLEWVQSLKPKKKISDGNLLRPISLSEYVGQNRAKKLVEITVEAAKKEDRPLPNTLISGPFGQGKSVLARLMADLYGSGIKLVDAASVNKEPFKTGTFIIDEIHNLEPQLCDSFNIQIDSGSLHIIGCTTNPGALPAAFRSRFRQILLEPYSLNDISRIIDNVLTRKHAYAPKNVIKNIAKRSRFNPRASLNYLSFILDVASVRNAPELSQSITNEAFDQLGVDEFGFTLRDYAYMGAIPSDRSVGLQYISAVTSIDQKTIEEEIEPYLMQMGLVDRSTRGRRKIKEISSVY